MKKRVRQIPPSPQSNDYQGVSIAYAMLISFLGGPDESSLSEGVGQKRNSGLLAA